ncbi:uncharacterized protein LOC109020433 [Juglans regia]|uniref:Uncharacterized protein LOC109020433 n=1 Tax=Juglans regia TaxID=51240 RepID=A0A6P9EQ61_JUGRE|nr:uncharacterized protein LOC109020433 [Juglans regia]
MDIATKLQSRSRRVFLKEDENNVTLDDIMKDEVKWWQARRKECLEKAAETHLLVAALITTVTFAAAITMPGGFVGTRGDPHYEGSAVLRRNATFKAFIIIDAISLVLSSFDVATHILMPLLLIKHSESDETRYDFLSLAFKFILMAMGAIFLAFISGVYVVLVHSLDLLVTTCVIGSCFFLILYIIYGTNPLMAAALFNCGLIDCIYPSKNLVELTYFAKGLIDAVKTYRKKIRAQELPVFFIEASQQKESAPHSTARRPTTEAATDAKVPEDIPITENIL